MPDPDLGIDADAIDALTYNTDDIGLSLDLADTLFALLDGLTARLDALENPAP